jgi:rhodanese-related sulfurtransferase
MAAAASALDSKMDIGLIKAGKYVGPRGSTALQLRDLATETGLWSRCIDNVSVEFVQASRGPLILNLRIGPASSQSGHWVAYLGSEGGRAVIFDNLAPGKTRNVSFGELALLMTREAVEVARRPPTYFERAIQLLEVLLVKWIWLLVLGIAILLTKALANSKIMKPGELRQMLIILGTGVGTGVLVCLTSYTGLSHNPDARAWIHAIHMTGDLPVTQFEQLFAWIGDPRVAILDARPKAFFDAGHIPGAENCPIDSNPGALWETAETLRDKKVVIVYCATSHCEWDKSVAWRLKASGISDVRVFEEGFASFVQKFNSKSQY